ncbi:MAG: 1,4-alpha-glucan branching protein GlgB [Myxococcota bacterium]
MSSQTNNIWNSLEERVALKAARHANPHRILGPHRSTTGVTIHEFHPNAVRAELLAEDIQRPMEHDGEGFFVARHTGLNLDRPYRIRWTFLDGSRSERYSPYQFPPSVTEFDLHLFNEGRHRELWNCLGAHPREFRGVAGVAFAVWAPNAERVSVVGDFSHWDGRVFPMRTLGSSGVFELFVPGLQVGELYKFEVCSRDGSVATKTDPMARAMEHPPGTASRVIESVFDWSDDKWQSKRSQRRVREEPLAIYEVHLGSWARDPSMPERELSLREITPRLVAHAKRYGFNAIELMPITEYPFDGSWGYQVSGYYAPSARYGRPDDYKWFINACHEAGITVLVDWVPAHFPRDSFALARFDGTCLYEHPDPNRGEHPDWGTLIFDYGRAEVRAFLIASALFWLREYHIDGLRVDAVASMLYLDYSRKPGAWTPNVHGGRENLDAVGFLRELNQAIAEFAPGSFTVAEESTAWPGVTAATERGGLGFTLKWNMGWMHDTLNYFEHDPVHRRFHQDELTFAMVYEGSECFLMPLSHDEVVHGKGSIYGRMPGERAAKLANLRLLYCYQYTRPSKKLNFMGNEIPQEREWDHRSSLDWHLVEHDDATRFGRFFSTLGALYLKHSALWRADEQPWGFEWIDHTDRENSVLAYLRRDQEHLVLVVLNLTPVERRHYRIGAPIQADWEVALNSDDREFGGNGLGSQESVDTESIPFHGRPHSIVVDLPPLGALVLVPGDIK